MLLKQGTEIIIGYEKDQELDVEFKYTLESDEEFPAEESFVYCVIQPEIEAHLGGRVDDENGDPRAQCWSAHYVTADGEYIDLINFEEETA